MTKRRNHSPAFKAKVALEALRGEKTLSELSSQYGIHANQISTWKKQLLKDSPEIFTGKISSSDVDHEKEVRILHEKIGQLTVEKDFLVRVSGKL
jgi:transposase-like protein